MEQELDILINYLKQIRDIDTKTMMDTKEILDSLAKPIGALGKLEHICMKLSGITGEVYNDISKRVLVIMCSDNGVVERSSTINKVIDITNGITAGVSIAKSNSTDIRIVDVGIDSDIEIPGVINRKIRKGTRNIVKGSAMSYEECIQAILVGIETVKNLKNEGYNIIGVGEIEEENIFCSSTLLIALTNTNIDEVLGEELITNKNIILEAIAVNNTNINETIETVSKVGGFDIAAMIGLYIGAAVFNIPIVVDGCISMVAALAAYRINPAIRDYMILSNSLDKFSYQVIAKELGLYSMLDLNISLGEGCGCPIAFSIIQSACDIVKNMGTNNEIYNCKLLKTQF